MAKLKAVSARRGNKGPHGRPGTEVRALAQEHTALAIEKLVELLGDENSCVALSAARCLLDRGYGKVPHIHRRKLPAGKSADRGVKVSISRFKGMGARDA